MYWWRITKYNPKDRDKKKGYIPDHWTSFYQIGEVFDDGLLTYEKYLATEDAYVNAVLSFMNYLQIKTLTITSLITGTWFEDMQPLSAKMQFLFEKKNRQKLSKEELSTYIRILLRSYIGAKLKHSTTMEVHFGYDYYMYIGSAKPCYKVHKLIRESGLFVENHLSPWLYL